MTITLTVGQTALLIIGCIILGIFAGFYISER